jgi:hypothetical protein
MQRGPASGNRGVPGHDSSQMTGQGEAICVQQWCSKAEKQSSKPPNVGPCGHNEAVKASLAPCGCEPFPSKVGQVSVAQAGVTDLTAHSVIGKRLSTSSGPIGQAAGMKP